MHSVERSSKSRFPISYRLFGMTSLAGVGLIFSGVVSSHTINTVKVNGNLYNDIVLGKDLIADVLPPPNYIIESYLTTHEMGDEDDPQKIEAFATKMVELEKQYDERLEFWNKHLVDPATRTALLGRSAEPAKRFFDGYRKDYLPAVRAGNEEKVKQVLTVDLAKAYDEHRREIDKTVTLAMSEAAEQEKGAGQIVKASTTTLVGSTLVLLGVVGAAAWWIGRGISRSLSMLADTLDFGARGVAGASSQLSSSSQSLAQGASEQAASLEESSSSINEIASMIKSNAEASQHAAKFSTDAKGSADLGAAAMERMNVAILDIERSSAETAKIIKTIDEIAFQTNLLALNAAVEAARAGDSGKGFAVVAEEVRNLAMRSADAAKNTSALIEQSVEKAKNGVKIAQTVSENLQQINKSTAQVTGLISEIAASSREQANGIEQISKAVGQMDKITQTNAANAEESAASSEELSSQAEQLKGCVQDLKALIGVKSNVVEAADVQPTSLSLQTKANVSLRLTSDSTRAFSKVA